MKTFTSFGCLQASVPIALTLLFSTVPTGGAQEPQKPQPDYIAAAQFDFDGDGTLDSFHLEVRKERDHSYNSVTKETSTKNFLWYRSWLEVRSGADEHLLLRDEWSVKESDMESFQLRLGSLTPKQYFDQYFVGLTSDELTFSTAFYETGKLEDSDINPEALKYSLRLADIPEEKWEEIQAEITGYSEARLFQYRADWAEDLRWVVYVQSLKRGIHYYFGYPE